ncbi:PASTA domain-containing protein [Actinosynnema sp. CA-248983]
MIPTRSTVAALGLIALTACAPPTTPEAPPPSPTAANPAGTSAAATTIEPPPTAKTCTVPDVVGMVHQTAQDTMQAAGLYRLREEDATGQGRVLVVDRNWTTTAQSVPAGQVVDCTTEVLLSAKKIGE